LRQFREWFDALAKQEQGEPVTQCCSAGIAHDCHAGDGCRIVERIKTVYITPQPKQEQGEPVAYIHRNEYNEYRLEPHDNFDIKSIPFNVDVALFKSPQERTWVGLTELEMAEFVKTMERGNFLVAIYDIEKKLKDKNT